MARMGSHASNHQRARLPHQTHASADVVVMASWRSATVVSDLARGSKTRGRRLVVSGDIRRTALYRHSVCLHSDHTTYYRGWIGTLTCAGLPDSPFQRVVPQPARKCSWSH